MTGTLLHLVTDPTAISLARWQFGLTTLYHYLFVPLTIGMILIVAVFQTAWVRTQRIKYLQLTKLFGKIFLINFAMGVVTGIVQEFQFGMNWSEYSRFVGDIFGAPLAMEGLFAFFLEATFIGLWIFGWNRLSPRIHLLTAWMVVLGTSLSAYFIIAANSFMQHPVPGSFSMATDRGRVELENIGLVLTNPVAVNAFPHTIIGAIMFAATVVVAVSAYHLRRKQHIAAMTTSLKFGAWTTVGAMGALGLTGDLLGKVMVATQPMKMGAAEALYKTTNGPTSFSIFTLGTPDGLTPLFQIRVPALLSFLSHGNFTQGVEGIDNLQAEYLAKYCDAASNAALTCPTDHSFIPIIWITYWTFRWMIGFGGVAALIALAMLWLTRAKAVTPVPDWAWRVAIWAAPLPLFANLVGWMFTEMGRQPWIVFGLMTTEAGISPNVPAWSVLVSLLGFTAVYGTLAVVEFKLIRKAAVEGPPEFDSDHEGKGTVHGDSLAVTY